MTALLTVEDLDQLHRYPNVIRQIVAASESKDKTLTMDLGELAEDPFPLAEAVLLARSRGVTLTSLPIPRAN